MAVNVRLTYRLNESKQEWGSAFKIGQMMIRVSEVSEVSEFGRQG